MPVPGTPYAAPFSQVFFAEASKDERELLGLGRDGEGRLLAKEQTFAWGDVGHVAGKGVQEEGQPEQMGRQ